MKFLVHGSIAYDLLLHHDGAFLDALDPVNLKNLSVSYLAQRFERHHGGTAANIAWNLRLLKQDPLLVGAVGKDGAPYLALLRERGVPTDFVQTLDACHTATAIIATDVHEHQISFFHPGADAKGKLPDLGEHRDDLAYGIVSPRDTVAMLNAAKQCAELKVPYFFDPGQQSRAFGRDEMRAAVKASAGLIVNAYEWTLASKTLEWSMDAVVDACGLLVITQGEKGLTLQTEDEVLLVPACEPDKVINPTGAGDALRAGLLTGLARKWPLTQAARLGAALASLVVAQEGTLLDTLDTDDLRARIIKQYGEDVPEF